MFFHSKQNETIIAAWAEPAEHNQLTLTECFSLLKWVDLAFPTFFYLDQHMNLSSFESITKPFCYKWQMNWQEHLLCKDSFWRHKQLKYRSHLQELSSFIGILNRVKLITPNPW